MIKSNNPHLAGGENRGWCSDPLFLSRIKTIWFVFFLGAGLPFMVKGAG